jgi:FKBP-type peptidyl-prolyl cis-trans isomerase SlyD
MSLLIDDNLVVSMHYTLTDDDGNTIDSSEGAEPLSYLHGAGNIIPGLEQALVGKTQGDACKVDVEAAQAYGEIKPEMIQVVPREAFEGVESIEVDMAFEAQSPEGDVQRIVVRQVEGDQVTVDANHPLAGMDLHFDVQILTIRDATAEEMSHGHVH